MGGPRALEVATQIGPEARSISRHESPQQAPRARVPLGRIDRGGEPAAQALEAGSQRGARRADRSDHGVADDAESVHGTDARQGDLVRQPRAALERRAQIRAARRRAVDEDVQPAVRRARPGRFEQRDCDRLPAGIRHRRVQAQGECNRAEGEPEPGLGSPPCAAARGERERQCREAERREWQWRKTRAVLDENAECEGQQHAERGSAQQG
jgi:hypothetical protein